MNAAPRGAIAILFLILCEACVVDAPAGREFFATVVVNPSGIGSHDSGVPRWCLDAGRIPVAVEVRNESGKELTVVEVAAMVVNAEGRTLAQSAVATAQRLHPGASAAYRAAVTGAWSPDAVLGISTSVVDAQSGPRSAAGCSPLCPECDNKMTQRACSRVMALIDKRNKITGARDAKRP